MKEGIFSQMDFSHPLPHFIVYCLPDGLWYLALLHANCLINNGFLNQRDKCSLTINIIVMSTPFLLEMGQASGHLGGTFDICDILTYLLTLIIYVLWSKGNSAMDCK